MGEEHAASWFDTFFWGCAVFVATCVAIDFLIGKTRRESMREAVGHLWLHLEEITIKRLLLEDARALAHFLQIVFGKCLLSWSRLIRVTVFTLIVTTGYVLYLYLDDDSAFSKLLFPIPLHPETVDSLQRKSPHLWILQDIFVSNISNVFTFFISLSVTLTLLRMMSKYKNVMFYLFAIILDIFISMVLTIGGNLIISYSVYFHDIGSGLFSSVCGVITQDNLVYRTDRFILRTDFPWFFYVLNRYLYIDGYFLLVSASPSLTHIIYTLILFFLKFTRVFIARPINLILLRFHESERGVLSNISIAVAVLAKLIQQTYEGFG